MKIIYIIVGVVAIFIAGVMLSGTNTQESNTNMTNTETTGTTQADMPMGMNENMPQNMDEMMQGNDVGMEMPETSMMNADADTADMMNMGGEMKMFNITGTNFAYDLKEIRVKQGDTVMLHIMSGGGTHDLVIDEFNVRSGVVQKGGMEMVTFVADKKGTFEYYCSVGTHRANGMIGKLIVE